MKLKHFIYFVFAIVSLSFLVNCGNQKKVASTEKSAQEVDTIVIENDSLEYKLIVLEVGFYSWLQTQKPRGYHSQRYMELKNRNYVNEYNLRARNAEYYDPELYPFQIKYSSDIDYGYEVNYLLFHYFLFFEEKYNQKLQ
ncbi:DUF6146 family protein [Psychroflexus planctonicus]|uniref:Lipoprotein n=1 Tax=Psychroflexus planctonicus TaxID=1526575 RepID=A0ABQ1SD05_9FLAO|nr:DUF6146 family protein [Psychroflexus planctonicus]GGE28779.1 hypothetical protein GCM10010832_06760 [Psychroflexus planctonicus]